MDSFAAFHRDASAAMDCSSDDVIDGFQDYMEITRQHLSPLLEMVLRRVIIIKPSDPIGFLAHHLRHFSLGEKGRVAPRLDCCEMCRKRFLFWTATPDVDSVISTEDAHWQTVNIRDTWIKVRESFGESLSWWALAPSFISKSTPGIKPEIISVGTRTVRIYVSSTPDDLSCERDLIVSEIIPRLSQWCAEQKLRVKIKVVDMRLRSFSDRSIEACLNQIRRCRHENTMVYFIGLIGDRYGYVPKDNEIPADVRRDFCFIPGMSVTVSEMFTGAVWDRNPNAIFMIRDSDVIDSVRDVAGVDFAAVLSEYRETDPTELTSLSKLKQLVKEALPEQVFDYSCTVERVGLDENRRAKLMLGDLEHFGSVILSFLQHQIEAQYPTPAAPPTESEIEIERKLHWQFATQYSTIPTGRDAELEEVRNYIFQDANPGTCVPTLVISGASGMGKSSILGYVATKMNYHEEIVSQYKLMVHFVGATASSTSLPTVLTRLWMECDDSSNIDYVPKEIAALRRCMVVPNFSILQHASVAIAKQGLSGLVIFIDAIDQLDEDYDALLLDWLPSEVPYNVRLIVSVNESLVDSLLKRNVREIYVSNLDKKVCREIVTKVLNKYDKTLTEFKFGKLLSKRDVGRPLWLALTSEEIKFLSRHEGFDMKVVSLNEKLPLLIHEVAKRLIDDAQLFGKSKLTEAALSLLCIFRFGLTESELRQMLAAEIELSMRPSEPLPMNSKLKISDEVWCDVYSDLEKFVRIVDVSSLRMNFKNILIRKVLTRRLLKSEQAMQTCGKKAAIFFQTCSDINRKALELPNIYAKIGDKVGLRKTLLDFEIFQVLVRNQHWLNLLELWDRLGGHLIAVASYEGALRHNWLFHRFPEQCKLLQIGSLKQTPARVLAFSSPALDKEGTPLNLLMGNTVHPTYGTSAESAWIPVSYDRYPFVELEYDTAVYATSIDIYESYNAGAVRNISVRNPEGQWQTVFCTTAVENFHRSRIFRPKIDRPKFKTNAVRIELDILAAGAYGDKKIEIDTVLLVGNTDGFCERRAAQMPKISCSIDGYAQDVSILRQFVHQVTACSSPYEDGQIGDYHAANLRGKPFVCALQALNNHIDNAAWSWSPQSANAMDEFVEVEFEQAVYAVAVEFFGVNCAESINSIAFLSPEGDWHTAYSISRFQQFPNSISKRFVPPIIRSQCKSKTMRIEVDQTACAAGRVQLYAIALFGFPDCVIEDSELEAEVIVDQYYEQQPLYEDEADDDEARILRALSSDEQDQWFDSALEVAQFGVSVSDLCDPKVDRFFSQLDSHNYRFAIWLYELLNQVLPAEDERKNDLYRILGRYFEDKIDQVKQVLEENTDKRELVQVYTVKADYIAFTDPKDAFGLYDAAAKLAFSVFGKFHLKTALALGCLPNYVMKVTESDSGEYFSKKDFVYAHKQKVTQMEILETLFGLQHPETVRASQQLQKLRRTVLKRLSEEEDIATDVPEPRARRASMYN